MRMIKQLRNFWIPCVTTIVLGSFSNVFAQRSYKITDMGLNHSTDNFSMVMGLNNEGWAENMDGVVNPPIKSTSTTIASGRAVINPHGRNIDLGTLGGKNSWTNYGGINDRGEAVGLAETSVPDPDGEDFCAFGTHLTCRPFLWQFFHMSALPTLGGNNGQASAINNRGQIVGFAENGAVDPTCLANTTNNRIQLPVLWENGKAQALPTGSDPGGNALWVNDQGQAVGFTGPCGATNHAVVWENGNVSPLLDYGTGAEAFGNNNRGQIVGFVDSPDSSTLYGALWQNGTLTTLGLLPGDFGGLASGINNNGQVVGSNFDSNFDWSHAFIWQDNVMTDLNTLLPASSNLFATMANKINERGQISGMAIVVSGPDKGNVHAFLATPVNESVGTSVADVVHEHPKSNLPANVNKQLLRGLGLGRLVQ